MNKKGLSIVEVLAVIAILGILSTIAIVAVGNLIENSRRRADEATITSLNAAVSLYRLSHLDEQVIFDDLTKEEVINLLVEEQYLTSAPKLQSKESLILWYPEDGVFRLELEGEIMPLSPYGDYIIEIAPKIIEDIQDKYDSTGTYGRTWGDYRYTDIGLDPDDWEYPILHLTYVPSGSTLRINIEYGYEAVFEKSTGEIYALPGTRNYAIIYNLLDEKWYYHIISEDHIIDFNTIEIREVIS